MNNNAIILLSGGLDSLVCLAIIKQNFDNIMALTFDYGQKAFEKEAQATEKISRYYNIGHKIIKLDWLKDISGSSLTSDKNLPQININELDDKTKTQKSALEVWVPNRNGLFVNIAACYAEALCYNYIVLGANKEEGATFKDNTIDFVNAQNEAIKNSVNTKVEVIAPVINMTKNEIVKTGIDLDIPFELLHSCYLNNDKNCGECESCLRLKRALQNNNRQDIIDKIF